MEKFFEELKDKHWHCLITGSIMGIIIIILTIIYISRKCNYVIIQKIISPELNTKMPDNNNDY